MAASWAERDARKLQIGGAAVCDEENGSIHGGPLLYSRAI